LTVDGLFPGASAGVLRSLADAFRTGRLGASASQLTITRLCLCPDEVVGAVTRLLGEGMAPTHLALLLDAHADGLEARMSGSRVELVWTGPEGAVSHSRDTSVVARDLFASAQRTVLVSTFVLRDARTVMEPLATRMDERSELQVRLFVHVPREWRDTRHESELLREYAARLRSEWPGERHPEVYYDPRSLSVDPEVRATWHAKCVVVDEEVAFLTSANFTEWAQQRNVEAGVVVRDRYFAGQLLAQFESLVQGRQVHRLPGF
jgi:phosphatidylserine/phosphatidylglycerophosphate/cardiolipin synthase-like enzyme